VSRWRGISLRQRFWAGIGGLLLVLALSSSSALWIIGRTQRSAEQVFRDNYSSVTYMHVLSEALERLHGGLKRGASWRSLAQDQALIDANVQAELRDITEVGEQASAEELNRAWQAYREASRRGQSLEGPYQQMKAAAWTVSDLNLKTMARLRGRDHDRALAAQRSVALLLILGIALGVGMIATLGRSILRPIEGLTRSVREVEQGRLELELPVSSEDELGQLAAAFNAMAGRLRRYQRGFLAKILRTQRSTQMAVNSFRDAVAVLDAQGHVELCNDAAERLFGLQPGATLRPGPLERLAVLVPRVILDGQAYEPRDYAEAIQHFPEGREAFALPRLLPVLDDQGRAQGVTLVLSDVTQARRVDEMKSNLLATVSHELKTPLTSLRMANHLLLEPGTGPLNPRQEALLQTAHADGERLHAVVQDLLDQGRRASGRGWMQFRDLKAEKLVQEAALQHEAAFQARGLRLECQVAPELPSLEADPIRLEHVFSNLLANALRYAPAGSRVELGARAEGAGIRFWVQDEGPGVPEEARDRVFERYFRVSDEAQSGGAGLGLAIAREIVELHGGEIALERIEGPGTRFSFWLPLEAPKAAP
jgi:signal transduction histidine kinase/HAMP domain-containing protein